jgi:ribosome biogenesis GTPase A
LHKNISKYDVDWSNFTILEGRDQIDEWKNHRYCFYPAMMHLEMYKDCESQLLKLDNDLECKKSISDLLGSKEFLLWKHERNVSKGRQYWGESIASLRAFGTSDFETYNIGVLGFPEGPKSEVINKMIDAGLKMSEMDVSDVVRFPDKPGETAKMWSCSEQTGYCYVLHQLDKKILTVEDYIDHHCYGFESKVTCIDNSKFLLK